MKKLPVALLLPVALATPLDAQEPAQGPAAASARTQAALARARDLLERTDVAAARAAVEQAIEADPDCVAAHELLLEVASRQRGSRAENKAATEALVHQYEAWCQRFPHSAGMQFGLGSLLSAAEDPRARPHLLEAARLLPQLAQAWEKLSADAERWGDRQKALEYMERAAAAAPASPDYAFYAATNLREVDRTKWVAASLRVAQRFPDSERGAQALYWLAERAETDRQRIEFAEQARTKFPVERFDWTMDAMPILFDACLRTDPARALALATELVKAARSDVEEWQGRRTLAEQYLEVQQLLADGKAADAAPVAGKMVIDRHSSNTGMIALLKAEVTARTGDVQAAYDGLVERLAVTPEDATRAALLGYGKSLGKAPEQVDADVRSRRDAQARPAPAFALQRYDSDRKTALADFRGKVVLLTFWFPGCGPCRGEFPDFEHVLAKFRGQDVAYVGVNGVPEQDGYVQQFMAGTQYTFTPLRGDEQITKDYGVRGYPTNFLIDRAGRIAYRNFRIDGHNEILLQRMIESLLAAPPPDAAK